MKNNNQPALIGGHPAFADRVPITCPTMPPIGEVLNELEGVLATGMITNASSVARFEKALAEYLGVRHVVAVSSCTSGLMLVLKAMGLKGAVALPSFTFSATGHALLWNGLEPRFVDIDSATFNISLPALEQCITEDVQAIVAVHMFGNPCEAAALSDIAARHELKLVFDSAHAIGAARDGRKVGTFGDAEVFSLSPTKLATAGEGGVVATNDTALAQLVRIGRNYGDPGNYNCGFAGLSARMPEFNAILGLRSLEQLDENVARRNHLAHLYAEHLYTLPGVSFQRIQDGCLSTYKDFSVVVAPRRFGLTRDELAVALESENVITRKYFDPPLHLQTAYGHLKCTGNHLTHTERVASSILSLPMFSHMDDGVVKSICGAINRIHKHAGQIKAALSQRAERVSQEVA